MWGEASFTIYRVLSSALSPFLHLHIQWRRFRGLEHHLRWRERFGHPSAPRPPGPLLWFHAVSLGEGMIAIAVIKHCLETQPGFTILLTTTTFSAFEVIKDKLPDSVIYQFAPVDTPAAIDTFFEYWKPDAVFLMESELWPILILSASSKRIAVALLNARVSKKSFKLWSEPIVLPLISLMLSKFCLIAPLSITEAIHFQLLQAPPSVIHFAGDLKYAAGLVNVSDIKSTKVEDLQLQITCRPIWMAASLHKGEEKVMLWVHKELLKIYPSMVTIIVPRYPHEGQNFARVLAGEGMNVALRSQSEKILPSTSIYLVDTLGELRSMYRLAPIAVIGGSFLPGFSGHNLSEAAAAGCAVFTGPYVGHFSHMVQGMQRLNPLSVHQVSGKVELAEALKKLLGNSEDLNACRTAARQAYLALSSRVVENVWKLVNTHALRQPLRSLLKC